MIHRLDIRVLVDNEAADGLQAEHGLALWIAAGNRRILFDTGKGPALPGNAARLGTEWGEAEMLVLSHGHYDHTGAVPYVLAQAPAIHVHCHPSAVLPHYSVREGSARAIGMSGEARIALDRLPDGRLHWVGRPESLGPGLGLTGPIPRETPYEDTGGPFYLDPEGRRPDPIEDDLALWIDTPEGLVVCAGCCHAGVVNTLRYALRLSGSSRLRAVVGGFHLNAASERRLAQTAAALQALGPDMLVPCHCTGEQAFAVLRDALGAKVRPCRAGMTFTL